MLELSDHETRQRQARNLAQGKETSVFDAKEFGWSADNLRLVSNCSQYIVNHTEALPDYYRTASLWNPHREEFLAILSEPDVALTETETVVAGESLLIATRRNEAFQESFLHFFDAVQTILTTSNVIGEIQGLQTLKGQYQREFWLGSIRLLREKRLDERLLCLLDMESSDTNEEFVQVLGPTDTGLLQLAKNEGCRLLTDDRTLRSHAKQEGIECSLILEILDE